MKVYVGDIRYDWRGNMDQCFFDRLLVRAILREGRKPGYIRRSNETHKRYYDRAWLYYAPIGDCCFVCRKVQR